MAVGYQKVTSAGVINTSGRPVIVFGAAVESKATAPGAPTLYDGTSTSGTKVDILPGVTNEWVSFNYPEGRLFPNGLYVDIDSKTVSVVIWYQAVVAS